MQLRTYSSHINRTNLRNHLHLRMNILHNRLRSTLRHRTHITNRRLSNSITSARRIINTDLSKGNTTTGTTTSRQIVSRSTAIQGRFSPSTESGSRYHRTYNRTRTSNNSKTKRHLRSIMRHGTKLSLTTQTISRRLSKDGNINTLRMRRIPSRSNYQLNISKTTRLRLTINGRLIARIRTTSTLTNLLRSLQLMGKMSKLTRKRLLPRI